MKAGLEEAGAKEPAEPAERAEPVERRRAA
jgi:hypothetical protein